MAESKFNRRDMLRRASGTAAVGAASYSRILGANDRIHLGFVGCGGRGQYVMDVFRKNPEVEIAAVCDVWADRVAQAREKAPGARGFADHRALLEMKDLDAVDVSTPDHWHAAVAIDAMNAGKDVYVEKPLTLRIEEGPAVVKAARVNHRICQVGMQRRSGIAYLEAKRDFFDTGHFGKLLMFRSWWHKNPVYTLRAPDSLRMQPANLDWARFLGQVRWRDWDPQQYWCFRSYLDFGGGQVTDLFTHWIDVVHMFTGSDIPDAAVAAGGIYSFPDGRTSPDTIHVGLEYPEGFTATFDAALAASERTAGAEFIGTGGRLIFDGPRAEYHPAEKGAPPVVREHPGDPVVEHVRNFLDCVRTRRTPNADVLAGHRSARAAHLCNIAYKESRRIRFDPQLEAIVQE
jgi:predicted dehydrogenase